jgi:hypothetical protein
MARGGYRQPANPAPVSGPGSLSQRTDGRGQPMMKLPNPEYGEQTEFAGLQAGAAMSQGNQPQVVPLTAPTMFPNEPVTAGSLSGPGPGPEGLGLNQQGETVVRDFQMLREYLPLMQMYADSDGSTGTMRAFVRYLRGVAGA